MTNQASWSSIAIFTLFVLTTFLYACDNPLFKEPGKATPNKPPETTMVEVPVEGDTLFANVTLHWDGGDPDGFPQYYQWSYITLNPQTGDTLNKTEWFDTEKTSQTITFTSPLSINKQIFRVRAVDNKGEPDPTPATRSFFTEQTIPPKVNFIEPSNNASRFYLDQQTDWYTGLKIAYQGNDEDGEILEYGWAVNDDNFTWTSDTTVVIPPSEFGNAGDHIIRLTARDDTDLQATDPDTLHISLVKPTFDKGILIIDETQEDKFKGNAASYTDHQIDSMYSSWISPNSHDSWDLRDKNDIPSREVLGQYKMIFWHADNWYSSSSDAHRLRFYTDVISEYMNVGGDFIMSGWKILKSLRPNVEYPATFQEGSFERDYLHIQRADISGISIPGDFVGANGVGENFTDVRVDSTKTEGWFPNNGNMVDITTIPEPGGFTSPIYAYECKMDCDNRDYVGQPVGLRYLGTSYDAIMLGFPLFFLHEDHAETAIDEILTNMEYREPNK